MALAMAEPFAPSALATSFSLAMVENPTPSHARLGSAGNVVPLAAATAFRFVMVDVGRVDGVGVAPMLATPITHGSRARAKIVRIGFLPSRFPASDHRSG